ncbi:MAG TPA: VWA domain-containing protein [Thermoanaerobaculia bacterium]|nr:VWA domain-containing protein [Thermoanaerobaculia bacterium]
MIRHPVAWLAVVAFLRCVPASPADPPQRLTGERTDVVAIEIPIQVARDGQPVRGLTAANFTIWEGKTKQEVTGFEVIDLAAASGSPTALPAHPGSMGRRHFLMLFDLANSEPKAIVKAREAAHGLLVKLHPSDLIAVATYSPSQGSQILLGFTSDRRQVEIALDTLGVPELVERSGDPLELMLESVTGSSDGGVQAPIGRYGAILLDELTQQRDRNRVSDRRFQAKHLSDYTRSLADLGQLMANVNGRKYVVLLSEGFDSSLLVGTEENNAESTTKVEQGQFYLVDNDARFGETRGANQLERMLEQFRRADCVIQAVDIGGLREQGARRANGQDALFAMADQTGGELFRNWNDLSQAMGKMLERTSVTYLVSFQPQVARDGAYHPVHVELANVSGAKVSHRAGYYAPLPFGQRNPNARRLDTADAIMSGREGGDLMATALALPFRGTGGKAYLPVVVEIDGPSLLRGIDSEFPTTATSAATPPATIASASSPPAAAASALPVEIYAYALTPDGTIGDFFSQTLGLDLDKVGERIRQGGIEYVGHLELAAGDWSLRVLVRNSRTGALRLSVVPVHVPAFDEGKAFLLSPLFPHHATEERGALLLRESPRGEMSETPYPFQAEGQPFVPAATPVAAAGQAARVALFAWNLPASDVRARAQVLDPTGREIPGGKLRLLGSESAAGGGDLLLATFEPTDLAPGLYRLRVRLTFGEGVEPVDAEAIPFEVR